MSPGDLGPHLPPRMVVYQQAREVQRIAQQAAELATAGPRADLPRAVRLLEQARAVLGSE